MATHRTWRVEVSGQKHTVELELSGMGRVRILVDGKPEVDDRPFYPAPRYELTVAGQPAAVLILQQPLSVEYELELAGQNLGRGVPASAKEIANSERLAEEAGAAEDRVGARFVGIAAMVGGAVMAAYVQHDIEHSGAFFPVMVVGAGALMPAGLAMLVLGEWEPRMQGDDRPTPWRTKVALGLGAAGGIIGMGVSLGLGW